MKFSQMPYERPDIEQAGREVQSCIDALQNAADFAEADAALHRFDTLADRIQTQFALARIRHKIDTNDAFYDAEANFISENAPLLQQHYQKWNLALKDSRFRPDFEKKYGELLLHNIEVSLSAFSPKIIGELQREDALVNEYQKLIASAQIPFQGGVYTLAQMTPFKMSVDDAVRRAAWEAEGRFFQQNGEKLDSIYDEQVKVRDAMGRKMGFDNYVGLGYRRMMRSYTPEDVDRFRKAVVRYIVPVAEKLQKARAQRMGFSYPMSYADSTIIFRDGNAKPQGTAEDILNSGKKFYHELSPETAEFIDFMFENEMFDVLSKKGKAGGGFCSGLPAYKASFIFANFNGTQGDVEVVTHEAGHAFALYTSRNVSPRDYKNPTADACEIHSMSMEFFSWPWAEDFFGKDAAKFRYSHLFGAMSFIPYGTMGDHFQHIIYENPQMTPAQRHDVWRELTALYMPWIDLDDIPFYGEGHSWQQKAHIYVEAFYYIDYCLAQTVALQFWALSQRDRAEAWRRYMDLVRLGGSRSWDGLVEAAGMVTPFGDTALRDVAQAAENWFAQNPIQ